MPLRTLPTLLSLLLAIAPVAASAAAPKPRTEEEAVDVLLQASRKLFDALEYERALEQLSAAKKLKARLEQTVAINLLEGVVLAELQNEKALSAFRTALLLDPEAKLPVSVSPQVAEAFERIRREVFAPSTAEPPLQQPAANLALTAPVEEVRGSGAGRALIPAVAGGVLIGAGAVTFLMARASADRLTSQDPSIPDRDAARVEADRGRGLQTVSAVATGLGAVGLGIAGVFLLTSNSNSNSGAVSGSPQVMFLPAPGGAFVSVGGALP